MKKYRFAAAILLLALLWLPGCGKREEISVSRDHTTLTVALSIAEEPDCTASIIVYRAGGEEDPAAFLGAGKAVLDAKGRGKAVVELTEDCAECVLTVKTPGGVRKKEIR